MAFVEENQQSIKESTSVPLVDWVGNIVVTVEEEMIHIMGAILSAVEQVNESLTWIGGTDAKKKHDYSDTDKICMQAAYDLKRFSFIVAEVYAKVVKNAAEPDTEEEAWAQTISRGHAWPPSETAPRNKYSKLLERMAKLSEPALKMASPEMA